MEIGLQFRQIIKYFVVLSVLYVSGSVIIRYACTHRFFTSKTLSGSFLGVIALYVINFFTASGGFALPINIFNIVFSAALGIPGAVSLLGVNIILRML